MVWSILIVFLIPHLSEVKKVYEPAQFEYLGDGKVRLINKNFFADFSDKIVSWKLMENGNVVASDQIELVNILPQETADFQLEKLPNTLQKNREYILQVSLIQEVVQ